MRRGTGTYKWFLHALNLDPLTKKPDKLYPASQLHLRLPANPIDVPAVIPRELGLRRVRRVRANAIAGPADVDSEPRGGRTVNSRTARRQPVPSITSDGAHVYR